MLQRSTEQKITFILRLACAMCFIGHGAFGIITKPVWCNYFAVFGIGQKLAYQLMPVVGTVDILFGLLVLFYPLRGVFAWLVIWGGITALLRPLSGEPLAEFIERAGNYGAPLILLLLTSIPTRRNFFSRLPSNIPFTDESYKRVRIGLQVTAFLIFAGHGWLNLLLKKGLLAQYASLGFNDTHLVATIVGTAELAAAVFILFRPAPQLVFLLLLWKMGTELFYPQYGMLEWIERGGSYGVLLALWLVVRYRPAYRSSLGSRSFSQMAT